MGSRLVVAPLSRSAPFLALCRLPGPAKTGGRTRWRERFARADGSPDSARPAPLTAGIPRLILSQADFTGDSVPRKPTRTSARSTRRGMKTN